ncbi:uncharacterized protein LOC110504797 [Oncorhynchus mykiss]|uniref:uncharacterized protein LOC110504797 n=1 Tax=Oncorhynchus mykiss TaxID=8022 RepID=UPI0018788DF3|nr:uncharacterized protein LOC110504797 [Oncorhynchus mykiss]
MNEMPSVDTSVTFLFSVANKNPQSNLEMPSLLEEPKSVVMAQFLKKRPLSEGSDVNFPSNTDSSSDRCPPEEDVAATSTRSQSEENENHQCKKRHLSLSEGGDPDDVNPSTNTNVFSNGGPLEEDMDANSTSKGIEIHQRGSPSPAIINVPALSMDLPNQVENKLRDTFYLLQTKDCIHLKVTWAFLKSTGDVFVAILELNNIENMENKPRIIISHIKELLLEETKIMLENEEQLQNTTFSIYSLHSPSQITGHKITDLAELNKYGITTIFTDCRTEIQNIPNHFENISEFLDKFYSLQTKGCKQKFDTQHAWAFIESPCGGEPVSVGLFKLEDCKKMGKGKHLNIHTEKLLLEEVKQILKNNEKLRNTKLFIYTLNSPCLQNSGHDSCMDLLIKDSAELYKSYGIKTIVGYSKWYGLTGKLTTFVDPYISSFNHFNLIISSPTYENYCDKFAIFNTEYNNKKSHDSKSNFEDRELTEKLYDSSKLFLPNNISEVAFRLQTHKDIHRHVTNKFMSISNYHKTNVKTDEKKSLDLHFSIPHFRTLNQFQKVGEYLAEKFDLIKHIGNNLDRSKVHFIKWWTKTIEDEYTTFLRVSINRHLSEYKHRITVLDHIKKNPAEYLQFCHLPLSPFHKLFN